MTTDAGSLDAFQAEVARIALSASERWSFALAGGSALVAHGLLTRPTQDVDLFTTTAGAPGEAAQVVAEALLGAGLQAVCDVATNGDFARLQVTDGSNSVVVDLARDWRAHPPVKMSIGLVLHRDDAVSSKVSAMVGRVLPRDFIDVAAVLAEYDRAEVLKLLFERDPGVGPEDLALAVRQLDGMVDADFADYGLDPVDVLSLRGVFSSWPRDAALDREAREVVDLARSADSGEQRDGTPVTDEMIEAWADEAERGYDLDQLRSRRSGRRPAVGEPDSGESVRLEPEL